MSSSASGPGSALRDFQPRLLSDAEDRELRQQLAGISAEYPGLANSEARGQAVDELLIVYGLRPAR
jgi:hypothetical protein